MTKPDSPDTSLHPIVTHSFVSLLSIHIESIESTNYVERPVVPTTIVEKYKSAMGEYLGTTSHWVKGSDWHKLHVNGEAVAWINKGMLPQVEALQKALAEGSQVEVFVVVEEVYGRGPNHCEGNRRRKWTKEIQVRSCK